MSSNHSLSRELANERASEHVRETIYGSSASSAQQVNEWVAPPNGRASGPVLTSRVKAVLNHCGLAPWVFPQRTGSFGCFKDQMLLWLLCRKLHTRFFLFFFISAPFFSAQPGIAYRKAVFEPQVCLDVCLTNQTTFIYEITKNWC